MCINLGPLSVLISPLPLIRQGAKALGIDPNVASILTGDLPGHLMAQSEEKAQKKKEKEEKDNNEKWQRYFTSRDVGITQPKPVLADDAFSLNPTAADKNGAF